FAKHESVRVCPNATARPVLPATGTRIGWVSTEPETNWRGHPASGAEPVRGYAVMFLDAATATMSVCPSPLTSPTAGGSVIAPGVVTGKPVMTVLLIRLRAYRSPHIEHT